jgi:two-component system chemotaxis response regulator CheY
MKGILLVDDSEVSRSQMQRDLVSKGYKVFEAENGLQGLEVLEENFEAIDAVICDVNMPVMDGISMCQKVASDARLSQTPIIMLSTESDMELKRQGKEAGVKAWMTKPCKGKKMESLLTFIEKLTAAA